MKSSNIRLMLWLISAFAFGSCIGLQLYDDFPNLYELISVITGAIGMIFFIAGLFGGDEK